MAIWEKMSTVKLDDINWNDKISVNNYPEDALEGMSEILSDSVLIQDGTVYENTVFPNLGTIIFDIAEHQDNITPFNKCIFGTHSGTILLKGNLPEGLCLPSELITRVDITRLHRCHVINDNVELGVLLLNEVNPDKVIVCTKNLTPSWCYKHGYVCCPKAAERDKVYSKPKIPFTDSIMNKFSSKKSICKHLDELREAIKNVDTIVICGDIEKHTFDKLDLEFNILIVKGKIKEGAFKHSKITMKKLQASSIACNAFKDCDVTIDNLQVLDHYGTQSESNVHINHVSLDSAYYHPITANTARVNCSPSKPYDKSTIDLTHVNAKGIHVHTFSQTTKSLSYDIYGIILNTNTMNLHVSDKLDKNIHYHVDTVWKTGLDGNLVHNSSMINGVWYDRTIHALRVYSYSNVVPIIKNRLREIHGYHVNPTSYSLSVRKKMYGHNNNLREDVQCYKFKNTDSIKPWAYCKTDCHILVEHNGNVIGEFRVFYALTIKTFLMTIIPIILLLMLIEYTSPSKK